MLEVVFEENAAGSMKVAAGMTKYDGGATGVIVVGGKKLGRRETKRIYREAEERERRNWENAVVLDISRDDIVCLPILLSVGDIDEEGIGVKRESVMRRAMSIWSGFGEKAEEDFLSKVHDSFTKIISRAREGEQIRIWTGNLSDDMCGLYWIVELLTSLGLKGSDMTWVKLPMFYEREDGSAAVCERLGEVPLYLWGRLALSGCKLSDAQISVMSSCWKRLKAENFPLRAVMNGKLMSVPETLYDVFIYREIDSCNDEFSEADVIGSVLGKYNLGIGDAFIAFRIEQFIRDGLLEPVTEPEPGDILYRRILRKLPSMGRKP